MSSVDFDKLFNSFEKIKVGVIGDIMLDTYWWGKVDRISPEAPVPIVAVTKREYRIGGAANVALNTVALGASVSVISVAGNDEEGVRLINMLQEQGIDPSYVIKSPKRITTNKIRILGRNQQMMRLDAEVDDLLDKEEEEKLLISFRRYVVEHNPNVVIFEDYNKGVLTSRVIKEVIEICRLNNIITAVDPKRKHFFEFRDVDIFKPNLIEVREGLNLIHDEVTDEWLRSVHKALHQQLNHQISLITLSEKGIFFQKGNESLCIPTHIRKIADVSGAGDTVVAVAAVVYAASMDVKLMAEMANIAGGLVCEQVGTAAINKSQLREECGKLL